MSRGNTYDHQSIPMIKLAAVRPLLRVPSLCIHLQSAEERKSFAPNKETHLQPIMAMVKADLNKEEKGERHSTTLMNILSSVHPSYDSSFT